MTRTRTLLAAFLLTAACSKEPKAPPAPPPEPPKADLAQTPPEPPPPAPEEKKIQITEPLVAKYTAYLQEVVAAHQALMTEYGKDVQRIDKEKGVKQGVDAIASAGKVQKAVDEAEQKARAKAGLDLAEIDALRPAVGDVILPRLAYKDTAKQADDIEKQMKAQLAKLPADQRAEAEKQMAEMLKGMRSLGNATEARQKYGDDAVEAILKHEAELVPLFKQGLGGK